MANPVAFNSPLFSTKQPFLIALLAAVIAHIVLVVGVEVPKPEFKNANRDIDITLIDAPSTKVPEKSQFLAPENQVAQAQQPSKPEPVQPKPVAQKTVPPVKPTPKVPAEKPKPVPQKNQPIIKTPPEKPKATPQEKQIIKTPEPIKSVPQEKRTIKIPSEPVKPVSDVKPIVSPEKTKPMLAEQQMPKDLFQASEPEKPIEQKPKTQQKTEPKPGNDAMPEKRHTISAASLQQQITEQAVVATQRQASAPQIKTKSVSQVSANKSVAAQYKRDWEAKVERVGNSNYPEAANKPGFSAILTMDVGIKADGSIDSMRITQSSGIPELDEAAKKIVEMSAPFPPLPAALRKELDILLITRVWKFSDESGLITQ